MADVNPQNITIAFELGTNLAIQLIDWLTTRGQHAAAEQIALNLAAGDADFRAVVDRARIAQGKPPIIWPAA